jgi:hypothetical protein
MSRALSRSTHSATVTDAKRASHAALNAARFAFRASSVANRSSSSNAAAPIASRKAGSGVEDPFEAVLAHVGYQDLQVHQAAVIAKAEANMKAMLV